jgi:ElaB/YqjD/DUF883 family membrane-anchored ribosome-binding protein
MQNGNGTATLTDEVNGHSHDIPAIDGPAAKARLEEAKAKVKTFVDEHPVVAVAGAVAAGFVVGRLLSRM